MIGRVYKIVHSQSDICYVGSTINELRVRWNNHKALDNTCAIADHIKKHGADQFKIILIKEYEVVDRKHLLAYETLWMSKLKCINKQAAFNPLYNNKQANSLYHKQNKIKHEAERKAKIHCSICKYDIVERELQRHNRSARHQANLIQYHEPTREKKSRCDLCNVEVTRLNRHNKSAMHQANLSS